MRFTLCVFFSRKAARVECWLWPRTNVGTLSTCITQTHTSDSNNSRVKVKVSSPQPSLFSLTSHMVLDSWIPSLHVSCSARPLGWLPPDTKSGSLGPDQTRLGYYLRASRSAFYVPPLHKCAADNAVSSLPAHAGILSLVSRHLSLIFHHSNI